MNPESRRFPKSDRLRRARDFISIIRNSDSVREDGMVLYFAPTEASKGRLGVTVSRKVLRHAVERNRVKRLVREFFRMRKSTLNEGLDVVVKVVNGYNLLYNNNLCLVLEKLFRRSGLLPKV